MKGQYCLVLGLSIFAAWGCSDSAAPVKRPQPQEDMSQLPDLKMPEPDMCAPTSCQALGEVCGEQMDGCGGMLNCGVCSCQLPQDLSCGICGLGQLKCDGDSTVCVELNIPNLDEASCDSLLYVSSLAFGGDGSREKPLHSVQDALTQVTPEIKAILVAGVGPYEGPIVVPDGVSIIGGFTQEWGHDSKSRSKLVTKTAEQGHTFGAYADGLSQKSVLAYWEITTEEALAGNNNYGVYVKASSNLELRALKVLAGRAGDGEDGTPGVDGNDASSGMDGVPGAGNGNTNAGAACAFRFTPGTLSTGGDGGDGCTVGGGGGDGACYTVTSSGGADVSATDGEMSVGNLGGDAGGLIGSRDGNPGKPAMPFTQNAQNGIGGVVSNGKLIEGHWTTASDANGSFGADGVDGGGGGGGGGSWRGDVVMSAPRTTPTGPGGGGGGGGGCGATGGQGGTSGMGSFGLFVVAAEGLLIVDSVFESSRGGKGGDGAAGGEGGEGGKGGKGGNQVCTSTSFVNCTSSKHFGGDGGDGADGQDGGHGGGGAGGPSYGAFCAGTTLDTEGQVVFLGGGGGEGGRAGGPGATPGQDGLTLQSFQCVNE